MGIQCSMCGKTRIKKEFVGKPEGKRQLRRPTHKFGDNIKMYLKEIVQDDVGWIHLSQYRGWWWAVVYMVQNFHVSNHNTKTHTHTQTKCQ